MENQFTILQAAIELDSILFKQYQQDIKSGKCKKITYGTAGFRSNADFLKCICLRAGIFQGLISKLEKNKVLGLVITASHNSIEDNGLKQSDFDGAMIRKEFEDYVDIFMEQENLQTAVNNVVRKLKENYKDYDVNTTGMVFLGQDTRPSSAQLSYLIILGVSSVKCELKNFGEVTTPIIHYLVRYFNESSHSFTRETKTEEILQQYYKNFCFYYQEFFRLFEYKRKDTFILLDCANGVGGKCVARFLEKMKEQFNIITINTGQNHGDLEYLNEQCGAEYTHKQGKLPRNSKEILKGLDCIGVCFDGDADRIMYYLPNADGLSLLDGDKQISLVAVFFKTILQSIQSLADLLEKDQTLGENFLGWEIGMVQTAYANGASTNFLKSQGLTCTMAANGVKNSHPIALTFDVGIYCESNGHGTFHVSHHKIEILQSILATKKKEESNENVVKFMRLVEILHSYIQTQNSSMGDAMTNFMCFEQALAYLDISHQKWLGFYQDLKCLNSTVKVADRTKIKVVKTEDRITHPQSLQDQIDEIVCQNPGTRAFIRPSGTEDIVRVYVEASEMSTVKNMIKLLTDILMSNKEIN